MKPNNALCGLSIAVVLQLGVLAGSAQTNIYLFSGSETNLTRRVISDSLVVQQFLQK